MRITHPGIIEVERLGDCFGDKARNCCFCCVEIGKETEMVVMDRFGRIFCSDECRGKYYGRKLEGLE